jgi:hypothetical protein
LFQEEYTPASLAQASWAKACSNISAGTQKMPPT